MTFLTLVRTVFSHSPDQSTENQRVNWIERIPIEQAEQTFRLKKRRLREHCLPAGLWLGFELESIIQWG